jgi:TonB family protein
MNRLMLSSWVASGLLHSMALAPLVAAIGIVSPQAYHDGEGQDSFKLDQGMTIEMISIGDSSHNYASAEMAPMIANPTPAETKPTEPEIKSVITATQSPTEVAAAVEEPRPDVVKPLEIATRDQVEQIDLSVEKSAGATQNGGKATALNGYVGKIHGALQQVRLNRRVKGAGQVIVGFTIDPAGRLKSHEVIKSSGIASVDKAALEMVEKASFPPPPEALDELYEVPLTFGSNKSG